MIKLGADVNCKDKKGDSPLYLVARLNSTDSPIAELLLAAGADTRAENKKNYTPLEEAIEFKNLEAAKIRIAHEGDKIHTDSPYRKRVIALVTRKKNDSLEDTPEYYKLIEIINLLMAYQKK